MNDAIDTTTIETPAGEYTLEIHYDEVADQPYNEGFILVTNGQSRYGYDSRIDISHGEDPLMEQVKYALSNSYNEYHHVSGAALVRWLQLHGRRGVTLVHVPSDYTPDTPSTDRSERIYGVAWAPDDATDPDAYVKSALAEWTAWARGEVFGWKLIDPSGDEVESVWGYYEIPGEREYVEQEATELAQHDAQQRVDAANTAGAGFVGIL